LARSVMTSILARDWPTQLRGPSLNGMNVMPRLPAGGRVGVGGGSEGVEDVRVKAGVGWFVRVIMNTGKEDDEYTVTGVHRLLSMSTILLACFMPRAPHCLCLNSVLLASEGSSK
jgi:hypothetical protein